MADELIKSAFCQEVANLNWQEFLQYMYIVRSGYRFKGPPKEQLDRARKWFLIKMFRKAGIKVDVLIVDDELPH